MSHESTSRSLGMISTATRTTATVCPLTPLANGSAAAQSAHSSGFAAALRQLAKQAEDPKGCSSSSQSPSSSPATSLCSPVITPKRGTSGLLLTPGRGPSFPSTPPVVTISPTPSIISNSLWRGQEGQCVGSENSPSQEKVGHPVPPPHIVAHPSYPFGLNPSSIMQDRRLQGLNLPGQDHPAVPSGSVPEEYLRGLRPFNTSDDLRLSSLPLGLDPTTAAHVTAAAAYYHPAYLHHLHRMEQSLCLSALRSQFYSLPAGGAFPHLHPSALHMHLPGARYTGELSQTHSALAERLQMEEELRQRERERERECERETQRKQEVERERERDMDRQKEKQRERQMVRALESQYLTGLKALTAQPEDRVSPGERLTPNRLDKSTLPVPKHMPPGLWSSKGSVPQHAPNLGPSQKEKPLPPSACASGLHGTLASATKLHQANGEEHWLVEQRGRCRQLGEGMEPRGESYRSNFRPHESSNREVHPQLGAPPPLISPKPHTPLPHPSANTPPLWNPVSLTDTSLDPLRRLNSPVPPSRPPPGLTRVEWHTHWERGRGPPRFSSVNRAMLQEATVGIRPPLERSTHRVPPHHQHSHLHQKGSHSVSSKSPSSDSVQCPASFPSLYRDLQRSKWPGPEPQTPRTYNEIPQEHRNLVSKLDLEESRRREAREEGHYYDLDESYDDSDEDEVRAHLRRVSQQPPLKLDTSSEKLCFLRVCGLTTLAHRDQLLHQKRRKRRRMLRERSVSPPSVPDKRKAELSPLISTTLTPEQMNCTPKLEDKKHFLNMLSLSHVSSQQRKDKEKIEGWLKAVRLKGVTLDTIRYNSLPSADDSSPLLRDSNGLNYPDSPSPSPSPSPHHPKNLDADPPKRPSLTPCHPPPLVPHPSRAGMDKCFPAKNLQDLQEGAVQPTRPHQTKVALTGKNRPWERITSEDLALHFQRAECQSTHRPLGESRMMSEPPVSCNISPPEGLAPFDTPPHPLSKGNHPYTPTAYPDPHDILWDEMSEETEEEEEAATRKWRGIESVFEAYHQYMDERGMERQVLHKQCRRLESHNYTLSLTAEQLSDSMAELTRQRQTVREERERLHAQLEHFRKCLTLPNVHWGSGQVQGRHPR
ncbi:hypothetical protein UPYG_G00266140 [Umbra pygmaea]|uniref:Genetic suppressor element-like domain-containing protein n=1 Tax=Umbra pygmaea TaxID=75934 RepID=A0ABD0WS32_UMBPY